MLQASPVSPELAHSIAAQHLRATTSRHAAPGRTVNPTLLMTARSVNQTVADYYVFSAGMQDGYVIVAGDDRAPSVLAYSDEGTFDPADMPDGMRYMLDVYAQEMAMLRNCPASYSPASRAQRENVVRPMLTCNWNQKAPSTTCAPPMPAVARPSARSRAVWRLPQRKSCSTTSIRRRAPARTPTNVR